MDAQARVQFETEQTKQAAAQVELGGVVVVGGRRYQIDDEVLIPLDGGEPLALDALEDL